MELCQGKMKSVLSVIAALAVCIPLTGADEKKLQQLDSEAKKFFMSFTKALQKQEADGAVKHVAPKYREGFVKGYRFWRGAKFTALKVIEPSDKEGILRVKTEMTLPSGRKDIEIKKLLRIKDKWFLFEK